MNAYEFIKQYGLDLAHRDIACLESGFITEQDFIETNGFEFEELRRVVESHENLELLGGIKKGKEILDGAPVGSDGFVLWTGKVRYLNGSTKCIFSDKSNEWSPANVMVLNLMIFFDTLKDVIADVEACQ